MTDRKATLRYFDADYNECGRRTLAPEYLVFDELVTDSEGTGEVIFEPAFTFLEHASLIDGGSWPRHVDFMINFTKFITTSFRHSAIFSRLEKALQSIARQLGVQRIINRAEGVVVSETEAILDNYLSFSPPNMVLTIYAKEPLRAEALLSISSAIDDIFQKAAEGILRLEEGVQSGPPKFYVSPKPPRVFICHSSRDKATARQLCSSFRANNIEPWIDDEQIAVGDDFVKAMEQALMECDFVTVVLTPNFLIGPWAQEEYRMTLERQVRSGAVRLLPALFETCNLPAFLRSKHYADFRSNIEEGVQSLTRTIKRRYEAKRREESNA